ncbi:MAG: hypothetical protein ACJ8BW_28335, partial [Ktedonobacteraceae bacterium]
RPSTSCVPGIVPEAITTSAQGPVRFDPGAAPIRVVCHAVVFRVGKPILVAVAANYTARYGCCSKKVGRFESRAGSLARSRLKAARKKDFDRQQSMV